MRKHPLRENKKQKKLQLCSRNRFRNGTTALGGDNRRTLILGQYVSRFVTLQKIRPHSNHEGSSANGRRGFCLKDYPHFHEYGVERTLACYCRPQSTHREGTRKASDCASVHLGFLRRLLAVTTHPWLQTSTTGRCCCSYRYSRSH